MYIWGNTISGSPMAALYVANGSDTNHIHENRDYYFAARGGYTPYAYPHPLRGETPAPVVPVMRQNVRLRFG